MKRYFIILKIDKSKIRISAILFFAIIFCSLLYIKIPKHPSLPANTLQWEEIDTLNKENSRLKGVLNSFFPVENKILYMTDLDNTNLNMSELQIYPIQKIQTEGEAIKYRKIVNDNKYIRPLYTKSWTDFYFRNWSYIPRKVYEARQKLFVYYGGASNIFDFEGSLGLNIDTVVDYHNNINLLIYQFDVDKVFKLGTQIVFEGKPHRTGAEIISIKLNEVIPEKLEKGAFLFQLATPGGYEVQNIAAEYQKFKTSVPPYAAKPDKATFADQYTFEILENLREENSSLKRKLSEFVPLDGEKITQASCKLNLLNSLEYDTNKIADVQETGYQINFETNYMNKNYLRPVYHPFWAEHSQERWTYIPNKICEGLHKLFVLPSDSKKRDSMLGSLAFFEKIDIQKEKLQILVYSFNIKKVVTKGENTILVGTPTKTGARVISIPKDRIYKKSRHLFQLVTPDNFEVDFDVIK